MNLWGDGRPRLSLADIAREFPGWTCWTGASGDLLARPRGREWNGYAALARGTSPALLRDEIIAARWRLAAQRAMAGTPARKAG